MRYGINKPDCSEGQEPSTSNAEDEYRKSFSGPTAQDNNKTREALNLAVDVRKFEIGLYWQRAAYFWALIAAAFAGYFAILNADKLEDRDAEFEQFYFE
ncbi:MAG: hypothetical protein ACREBW_01340 [Candidatus Micrarchaeaceae archaeon]